MNKNYILDNKIEKEFNKYLFEIEKGKYIHVKELLSEFEHSQKLLEDLAKQLQQKENIINELERHLHQEILEWQVSEDNWIKAQVQEDKVILDKLKELKEGSNENNKR